MPIHATTIGYDDGGGLPLEGYLSAPATAEARPGVVVVPTWLNVDDGMRRRADRLAALGYAAFVLDLFGAGVRPAPPQNPLEVIHPFIADRTFFRRRLLAGIDAFRKLPACAADRVAVVGFCVGGCGALELARAGAPVRGVVSLHGLLDAPLRAQPGAVRAKVLVLHGDADPLVPVEQVLAFQEEMRRANVDWQVNVYGGARHSFTGEGVAGGQTAEAGRHPQADDRAWDAVAAFLREVLE